MSDPSHPAWLDHPNNPSILIEIIIPEYVLVPQLTESEMGLQQMNTSEVDVKHVYSN